MEKIDIQKHPVLNAYCLYVFHRFRLIDDIEHATKYRKRSAKEVQEMENIRSKLHKESLKILKEEGFTKKQSTKFLESGIDKLIKKKSEPLKKGENYCGLCQIKVKTKEWSNHEKTEVHKYIGKEVIKLNTIGIQVKLDLMKNKVLDVKEVKNEINI